MATIDIQSTQTIKINADELWGIIGDDFADVHEWATDIAHSQASVGSSSTLTGAPSTGRSCDLDGFGKTDERLVSFDAENMSLAYTVTAKKLPSFVKDMLNEWTVESAEENQARVTAHITANATGIMGAMAAPMMRIKLRSTMKRLFNDLKIYAETGDISPAKNKALAKARD